MPRRSGGTEGAASKTVPGANRTYAFVAPLFGASPTANPVGPTRRDFEGPYARATEARTYSHSRAGSCCGGLSLHRRRDRVGRRRGRHRDRPAGAHRRRLRGHLRRHAHGDGRLDRAAFRPPPERRPQGDVQGGGWRQAAGEADRRAASQRQREGAAGSGDESPEGRRRLRQHGHLADQDPGRLPGPDPRHRGVQAQGRRRHAPQGLLRR
jgi:hypothetical protein